MADRVFYPLVLLIALGAIAAALAPGPARVRSAEAGLESAGGAMIARGDALRGLETGEGVSYEIVSEGGGPLYARARADKTADTPPLSSGLFVSLPPAREAAYAGQALEVSVLARAAGPDPADSFSLGYFVADERGDSGWRTFQPTREFERYGFTFIPGEKTAEPNLDYVGIWPDTLGQGGSLEIAELRVEPVAQTGEGDS